MRDILKIIVNNDKLHAKWLNTLSYLENTGARKISACENDHTLDLIQLKHAAEEHRHAYYLKKQIFKLNTGAFTNYKPSELFAPIFTKQYLRRLDVVCSRYLMKHFKLSGNELKFSSYLFVTYAIEMRADELYPVYQEILSKYQSKIMVKSIIAEEEGHLEEMNTLLDKFHPCWNDHAKVILAVEKELFSNWLRAIKTEVIKDECTGTKVE